MDFYFSLFRSGTRKADNALTLQLNLTICTKRLDFGLAIIKVEIRYSISFFYYRVSQQVLDLKIAKLEF